MSLSSTRAFSALAAAFFIATAWPVPAEGGPHPDDASDLLRAVRTRAASAIRLAAIGLVAPSQEVEPPAEPPANPPENSAAAPDPAPEAEAEPDGPSEAEQIAQLQRSIEGSKAQVEKLQAEVDDPKGEYAQAEAEFRKLDEARSERLKAGEDAAPLTDDQVAAEAKVWQLAKDRFDLAIEERKAHKEQITSLQDKLRQDQEALDRLTGAPAPAPAPAPAETTAPAAAEDALPPLPGSTSAPSTAPPATATAPATAPATATAPAATTAPEAPAASETPVAAPASGIPGIPGVIDPSVVAPDDAAKPPSKELIAARQKAERIAQAASEAETAAQSVKDRLASLDRNIELEKKALGNSRKKADNAAATRTTLSEEFEARTAAGAPQAELRSLASKVREARGRLDDAQREAREHANRLDDLQSERAALLAEGLAAAEEAATAREAAVLAEKNVEKLENPFSPMNLLRWVVNHGPRIGAIILAMVAVLVIVRFSTKRIVMLMSQGGARGSKEEREDRAGTLVGVFRNAASVITYVGGILMLLQEVGIPIAPLLGGAAIFGLAIAFGAQNLVRDYFYGFVILLENQYKLNDVVKIGDKAGQVEKITLRMTVLRAIDGCVHFVPNGEITSVTNLTHGWSRALCDVGVAYKEDIDRVISVIKEIGAELRKDSNYRLLILEDLEMLGVEELGDSAVVVRFYIKTRTLKQWTIKREMLRRIKNRFDQLGIEIPFPHRTVYHRVDSGDSADNGDGEPHHLPIFGRNGATAS